jgi:hypothetical protein
MLHAMKKSVRHRNSILNAIWLALFLCSCGVIAFITVSAFALPYKASLYFYSSESTINNFKSLKMEFDRYLNKYGSYEFQPFSDRETFEKHIKDKSQCILLLSSWHFKNIYKEYSLKPVLIGTRNGKKYQERILVTCDEKVRSGRIASASSLQHTRSCLQEMLRGTQNIDINNILTVPKDIDALMSVGFGMSQFALTTKNSLEELKTANPMLYQKLKILKEGEESFLLIVAIPEQVPQDVRGILTIIQNMAADQDGKERLRMIEIDGWQVLDQSDRVKLEGR